MGLNRVSLSAASFVVVCDGPMASVRLSVEAKAAYDELKAGKSELAVRQYKQLTRYFERFCNSEPHRMTKEHYRSEGNHPDGQCQGGKVQIWAFKPKGWRLYGAVLQIDEKKCFVGVKVDPAKKQDKADVELLKAAAIAIGKLNEYSQAGR